MSGRTIAARTLCVRALAVGILLSTSIAQAAQGTRLPPLTGPYQVGTTDFFWVDRSRPEPTTKDPGDFRHILVKVYYPAVPGKDAKLAPYVPNLNELTAEARKQFAPVQRASSRSYLEAPIAASERRFPVLIYSHGGSWSRFTSNFVNEVMASYGYVVFSIDHTGFNKSTIFPDGYVYENDASPFPENDARKSIAENAKAFFDYLGGTMFPLWVGDAIFTLDSIEKLNAEDGGRFAGRLDLERVGAYGWSFGGATAIQLARSDPRIRAAVDHDGQLFGDVRETGTDRPIMLLHNEENANPQGDPGIAELIQTVESWNAKLLSESTDDWYDIGIEGSNHGSFSDLALFLPGEGGEPSHRTYLRQHQVIIELTRDFFDKYLRGRPDTPLLKGELQNYPELDFKSSARGARSADQRVPMRDGVELSTDIHLPKGEGPFPTVLVRTPYVKSQAAYERYELQAYVDRGYAVAFQDTRGQGLSGGDFNFYFPEGKDGYDTIEWIAAQPWSNGKVAMDGGSYLGTVQWLAALERPPHLSCIMPHVPSGRLFDEIPYVGGAFAMEWALPWIAPRYRGTSAPKSKEEAEKVFAQRPLLTMDEAYSGRKLPLYRDMLTHSTLDEYWQPIHVTPEEFATLDIPALTVTGWFDGDQPGALFYWSGMRANSPASDKQYLIIGPWEHAQAYLNGELENGELAFSALSALDMQAVRVGFLDWCLKGETNAFGNTMPRAMVYLTGADRWLELDDYPAPRTDALHLFLSSGGNANTSAGDGQLVRRAPSRDAPDRYVFDPKDPVPGLPGATDHSKVEERKDVLVYTGPILEQPLTVLGSPVVELYASSDARDTDFTAKLLDVYPDGRAVRINWTLGAIRARYRNGYEREELLTQGEPARFRIELSAIGHVFQPGHRIRIEISSSEFPYINPNQNTGNPVATDTEWRSANQTVHHSRKLPSRLELPVWSPR
jgi:putative CocE/NonD family hydrolase